MFDFGWSEMAIIVLLALVVIGPKDLPRVLRTLGQFMRKARSLSREFQSGLNDVMREAELDEARKAIEGTRAGQLDREIRKALDPDGEVDKELRDLDREARDSKTSAKTSAKAPARPPSPAERLPEPAAGISDKAGSSDKIVGDKVVKHPAGSSGAAKTEPAAETDAAQSDTNVEPAKTVAGAGAQKTG